MALERALDRVPDVARAVVWLHDVEGYTHAEIGRLMGRTTSFSKSQLARAHERLRGLLEGEEAESETALCTPEPKTC
jgi:RNA polymerase sigma-70 factor (ECF subfamily)